MKYFCVLFLAGCVLSSAWADGNLSLYSAGSSEEEVPESAALGNPADQERYRAFLRKKEGREAAIAFLRAKGTEKMLNGTFQRLLEEQCRTMPELQPYRQILEEFYRENLGFEALKVEIADLYLKHFSVQELKDLTAFYQSELGKKYAAAEVSLSPEFSLLFLKRQQEKIPELEKRLQSAKK